MTDFTSDDRDSGLSSRTVTAYAVCVGPSAILGLPFSVYLPPYISESGVIAVGLVGLMFSISTLWDGVVDPLIGRVVDRSTAQGTTHRTWMWRAAMPLSVLLVLLLAIGDVLPFWFLLPLLLLFYSAYSLYDVAYLSWGSALTTDSDASSRLFGAREWASKFLLIAAFAVPAVAQAVIPGLSLEGRIIAYASLLVIALPLALAATLRLPPRQTPVEAAIDWRGEVAVTLRNRSLLILFAVQLFNSFAFGTLTATFVFFADAVLELDGQSSLLLFATFVGGGISAPLWIWIARRFGKVRGMIGKVIFVGAMMTGAFFAQPVGLWQALAFTALLGSGFVGLIFIYGLLADLAPHDRAACGRDRSAFLFAITMLMQKIGVALAIAVSYALLDLGGFDAKNAGASAGLVHMLFTGVPTLAWGMVGMLLLWLGRVMPVGAPLASARHTH